MAFAVPEELQALTGLTYAQVDRALEQFDPLTWTTTTAKIRLPRALQTISFEAHPFMPVLYRDIHPNIVALKGAQIGMSTWAIIRDLWALTTWPMGTILSLGGADINQHVATRINPIINQSEFLADRIMDVDSVHTKRFALRPMSSLSKDQMKTRASRARYLGDLGVSTAYFSGASTQRDAISRDVDFLIHDELDKSTTDVIDLMRSRISGPTAFKWTIKISTPTIPGYGIDREYRMTDQRKWLIKCTGCNTFFEMEFPKCLEPQSWEEHAADHRAVLEGQACPDCYYRCPRCKRRMTDEERGMGRWVAAIDDPGLAHGYSVSQMAALYVPASEILRARYNAVFPSHFWNMTMGIAHDEGASPMSKFDLIGIPNLVGSYGRTDPDRPMAGDTHPGPCFMGIDVGIWLDITIDTIENGVPRMVKTWRTNDWGQAYRLMDDYHVSTCVIDGLPETTKASEFAAAFNRRGSAPRVWLCTYLTSANSTQIAWRPEESRVLAPREITLSSMIDELLTKKVLPAYNPDDQFYETFIEHMLALKRVPQFVPGLERQGIVERFQWISIGADHQAHSSNYSRLARLAPRSSAPPLRGMISMSRYRNQRDRLVSTKRGPDADTERVFRPSRRRSR